MFSTRRGACSHVCGTIAQCLSTGQNNADISIYAGQSEPVFASMRATIVAALEEADQAEAGAPSESEMVRREAAAVSLEARLAHNRSRFPIITMATTPQANCM